MSRFRRLVALLLLGPAMTSWGQAVSGLPAPSVAATDTLHNASIAFTTGSLGDTSCPTPASGQVFLCLQSGVLNMSTNGAAYAPLGSASLTGSISQMVYMSAANTPSATSAIQIGSAGTSGPIGFHGIEYHIGAGPSTFTTLNGAITSSAASATLTSSTGYPSCSATVVCYAYVGNTNFVGEIVSFSSIVGNVVTLTGRGLLGTTASAQVNGGNFMLIGDLKADSTTVLPTYMHVYNGSTFITPTLATLATAGFGGSAQTYIGNAAVFPQGVAIPNGIGITSDGNNGAFLTANNGTQAGYITNSGVIRAYGNIITLTANAAAINSPSLVATPLVLPSIFADTGYTSLVVHGHCLIPWQNTAGTQAVTFGLGSNQTPGTTLTVLSETTPVPSPMATSITNTTATAVTPAITPGAASALYATDLTFTETLAPNLTNTVTVYADVASGGSLLILANASCEWKP